MFRKPYRTKSCTAVKASDRRKLRTLVENQYSQLSAEDLNVLIPPKLELNQVKAMTHGGVVVMIFYSGVNPVFFQLENRCFPSLYSLWKYPNLLPIVVTAPIVLEKISSGADLMAPGIIIDDETQLEFEGLKVNDICAVRLVGNKSVVAVGIALMSAEELCTEGVKGKAVSILHTYKDNLWMSGEQSIIPQCSDAVLNKLPENLENVTLNDETEIDPTSNLMIDSNKENNINDETDEIKETEPTQKVIEKTDYTMDEILHQSFISAVKMNHKKIQFPILSSTFYSTYVLKSCPLNYNLDIKKTTYKKLSVFLKKMQKEGMVQIKELTKGVESITAINVENDYFKSFKISSEFKDFFQTQKCETSVSVEPSSVIQENYKFPSVTELFVVSAQVKKVFELCNYRKGDSVPITSVRDVLKHYVKENSLQNQQNPREVILDPILCDCIGGKKDSMTWEELQDAIVCKMPHAYQIIFHDEDPIVKKGKLQPIMITVDTRTGNKKVTLIQNLEIYGINPEKLAQHVQVIAAASTSVTSNANGKGTIVLIQGNQVRHLQKIFLDVFKVPRKYIQGLENVPKKK